MKKIAWKPIGDSTIASSRLRAFIPCVKLAGKNWPVELYTAANKHQYKVVIFQKAYTNEDILLAEELKKNGTLVVLDQCDNHFYNPTGDPVLAERAERLSRMTALSDFIIASTNEIARLFPSKKVYIIPDFIEVPAISPVKEFMYRLKYSFLQRKKQLKIVWYGNAGSVNPRFGMIDMVSLIDPLEKVHKSNPLSLTIISNSPESFDSYLKNKTSFPVTYIHWEKDSFEYIVKQHDLCVIPVNQNPFTICKTNNRVVLTLLLGVPVIADQIPSYEEFSPYVLFSDWEQNIIRFMNDREEYENKVKAGKLFIFDKYGENKIVTQWEAVLNEIVAIPSF